MAKQTAGILGPVRGKVSNVVGAHWKETPYFRSYAVPANPQTEAQQAQRAKMTASVWVAKALLGSVINPYWDPFQKARSGYNRFCQVNVKRLGSPIDYLDMLITEGKLEPIPSITSSEYVREFADVDFHYDVGTWGNGLGTDLVLAAVLDVANMIAFVNIGVAVRSDGLVGVTVGKERDVANLKGYLSLYRGEGATLMVSPSVSTQPTEV